MKPENLDLTLVKLEDALTNYCDNYVIDHEIEVLFLGSQSILFYHRNINNQSILDSYEIDIILLLGDKYKEELQKISNNIDFSYGYGSKLHDEESFYIDNMTETEDLEKNTKNFPINWRHRANTKIGVTNNKIKFTFLDKHDVAILKLLANREKDIEYVRTLVQGSLLDKKTLLNSLRETEKFTSEAKRNSVVKKIKHYYSLPQINILNNTKFKPK